MNLSLILIVAALVVFIIAAIPAVNVRVNLIAVGLALLTAARLCGGAVLLFMAFMLSGCTYDEAASFGKSVDSAAYGYYGERYQQAHPAVVQPVVY